MPAQPRTDSCAVSISPLFLSEIDTTESMISSVGQQAPEERVNGNRSLVGASAGKRVRVAASAVALLAVAGALLGWTSRTHHAPVLVQSQAPLSVSLNPSADSPANLHRAVSLLSGLPLIFEPNQGQANLNPVDARARFIARGPNFALFLGSEGAILNLPSSKPEHAKILHMKLSGSNPQATIAAADPLPGKSNYLLGNRRSQWRTNVPQFARVRYQNVYPGINLVFYGNQGRLEYDFQVAPGSDPSQAELEFGGAEKIELQNGDLVIDGQDGGIRLTAPTVYQEVVGHRQPVDGRFILRGQNRVGFAVGAYDKSRELIIDPLLIFSTYFGGSGDEHNSQIAVDGAGNIFLAGSTSSPNLPVSAGVYQSTLAGTRNVYVAKITPPQGSNPAVLDYVTYLGGNGVDYPVGLAVDAAGDPFVAGTTTSTNFPVSSTPYQSAPFAGSTGTQHVFVTEMLVGGTALKYSSYLSGNGDDIASGMTIDAAGNIFVTGTTTSNNPGDGPAGIQFPASTIPQGLPFQALPSTAPTQFFVTKVNTQAPTTGSISYSTYFGGGNFVPPLVASGGGITVDSNGNIYFTGTTNFIYTGCAGCATTDFPIKNAYQPCLNQVPPTVSTNPPQCANSSTTNSDAFVAKLNPAGPAGTGQLIWSTYVGGTQNDSGTGVATDSGAANVFITGTTNSPDVTSITTFGAFQPCLDGPLVLPPTACPTGVTANDAFVARLSNPATTTTTNVALTYFSYLGGTGDDAGLAIAVDASSGAVVTGWTQSTDFPAYPPGSNDIQGVSGGGQDGFVARLNTAAATGQNQVGSWASYFGGSGTDQSTSVAVGVSNQNVYIAGDTNSANLHVTGLQTANAGGYDAFVSNVTPASSLAISGTLSLGTNQLYISAGSPATFTYTLTNNGPDVANNITFTDDISQQQTVNPVTFVSAATTSGTCTGGSTTTSITCSVQSLQSGSTATITVVLTPTPRQDGSSASFNGGAVMATAVNSITQPTAQVPATMSDFSVNVNPSSFSVPVAGDPAKYQVLVTPHPVFGSSISFACSNLPAGTSCAFSPSSVQMVGSSPSTTTLTISTTARPITTGSLWMRHFYAVWFCVPGLALLGFGSDRRRRRFAVVLLLCFLSLLILLQPACSHSSTQPPPVGTPAGSFPITVTANGTNDSKSQGVTLVVP